ncbi:hypothetical protein SAMN04490244_10117 [Tranquillimonas rosea]|uniref:Uncharacterized protein n=1 Tax=Tranquillimonas rosea TaxID=641238 RepID=A0A1H9P546_9RHOB|nr:hypothetical protein [Tranquillimonas rosea]SER43005.1 hypothetical protein SAMN04490244_10117 [Tranquillimonas rosea]
MKKYDDTSPLGVSGDNLLVVDFAEGRDGSLASAQPVIEDAQGSRPGAAEIAQRASGYGIIGHHGCTVAADPELGHTVVFWPTRERPGRKRARPMEDKEVRDTVFRLMREADRLAPVRGEGASALLVAAAFLAARDGLDGDDLQKRLAESLVTAEHAARVSRRFA